MPNSQSINSSVPPALAQPAAPADRGVPIVLDLSQLGGAEIQRPQILKTFSLNHCTEEGTPRARFEFSYLPTLKSEDAQVMLITIRCLTSKGEPNGAGFVIGPFSDPSRFNLSAKQLLESESHLLAQCVATAVYNHDILAYRYNYPAASIQPLPDSGPRSMVLKPRERITSILETNFQPTDFQQWAAGTNYYHLSAERRRDEITLYSLSIKIQIDQKGYAGREIVLRSSRLLRDNLADSDTLYFISSPQKWSPISEFHKTTNQMIDRVLHLGEFGKLLTLVQENANRVVPGTVLRLPSHQEQRFEADDSETPLKNSTQREKNCQILWAGETPDNALIIYTNNKIVPLEIKVSNQSNAGGVQFQRSSSIFRRALALLPIVDRLDRNFEYLLSSSETNRASGLHGLAQLGLDPMPIPQARENVALEWVSTIVRPIHNLRYEYGEDARKDPYWVALEALSGRDCCTITRQSPSRYDFNTLTISLDQHGFGRLLFNSEEGLEIEIRNINEGLASFRNTDVHPNLLQSFTVLEPILQRFSLDPFEALHYAVEQWPDVRSNFSREITPDYIASLAQLHTFFSIDRNDFAGQLGVRFSSLLRIIPERDGVFLPTLHARGTAITLHLSQSGIGSVTLREERGWWFAKKIYNETIELPSQQYLVPTLRDARIKSILAEFGRYKDGKQTLGESDLLKYIRSLSS